MKHASVWATSGSVLRFAVAGLLKTQVLAKDAFDAINNEVAFTP